MQRWGCIEYLPAWERMRALAAGRAAGKQGDLLILCEHPPTITLGAATRAGSGNPDRHLLLSRDALRQLGFAVCDADRGGDVTYHGPGQLVGYPILGPDTWGRDLHRYLRLLEEVLIRSLDDLGVPARRLPGLTGVWAGGCDGAKPAKIGAIGVKVRRGVTLHGFALNVAPDLRHFDCIIPCGLRGHGVTSLAALGRDVTMEKAGDVVARFFLQLFEQPPAAPDG